MFKIRVMESSDIMKKFFLTIASAILMCSANMLSAQSLEISHLAGSNTIVHISADRQAEYLMLPIEETARETSVKVICNNDLVRHLNIRLAINKVDYYVPMILDEWKGREIKLLTHSSMDRSTVRDAENELCWSKMYLAESFDSSNKEKFRPEYHHTPAYLSLIHI